MDHQSTSASASISTSTSPPRQHPPPRTAPSPRKAKMPRLHSPLHDLAQVASTATRAHCSSDIPTGKAVQPSTTTTTTMPEPLPTQVPPLPRLTLQSLDVIGTLGTGTFGRVLLVKIKDDRGMSTTTATTSTSTGGNLYALKVLEKAKVVKMKQVTHVQSEKEILDLVNHPFAVNLHATFQDSNCVYFLMEFAPGGEIFSYLRRAGKFPVDVTRFYIATLVLLLDHLHSQDIIYRDLKPENLLLDSFGYTKLTDFGFAKHIPKGRTFTLCGTPEFLAPEIIRGNGHGKAADWWALGILTYEMLCGHPPYWSSEEELNSSGPFTIYEKILKGNLTFPKNIDLLSKVFIKSLLSNDLSRRLGNLSGGSNDVKRHLWFYNINWQALYSRQVQPPIIPNCSLERPLRNFATYTDADPNTMPGLYAHNEQQQQQKMDGYQEMFAGF